MYQISHLEGYRNKWGPPTIQSLTPREREVLALVAQGKANQDIGEYLGISLRTVKVHLANIFEKLGVNRRTEAIAHLSSEWPCREPVVS